MIVDNWQDEFIYAIYDISKKYVNKKEINKKVNSTDTFGNIIDLSQKAREYFQALCEYNSKQIEYKLARENLDINLQELEYDTETLKEIDEKLYKLLRKELK